MYSKKAYEHFTNPQNAYKMENPSGQSKVGDSGCGDSLCMFIKVDNEVIKEISYLVYGCPAAIATSSMTSVLAKGKSIEEALRIEEDDVIRALDGLPNGKEHCSNLGVSALRMAIENYKNNF